MIFRNIPHSCFVISRYIKTLFGSLNKVKAYWWGVQLGEGVKFIGRCYFYRFPDTKIVIGDNCQFLSSSTSNKIGINRPCMISTFGSSHKTKIIIGNNCGFSGTVIGAFIEVRIGHNVRCGANTLITDSDWHIDDHRSGIPKTVHIQDNVWLGEGVKVLKGVTIGENSIIGAGSIVTKNIPANAIAAGNPCKVIKIIDNETLIR